MSSEKVIKQYRFLFEQISSLSEEPILDTTVCHTHLIAIHRLACEALAMDGAHTDE